LKAASQPVDITRQPASAADDPFAAQRTADNNPFAEAKDGVTELGSSPPIQSGSPKQDRRMSKEWGMYPIKCLSHHQLTTSDASKVPPSRFQKREGSIYATPGSRDGHVERNTQHAFTAKLKEKGWLSK
jgi:hypothetical protein